MVNRHIEFEPGGATAIAGSWLFALVDADATHGFVASLAALGERDSGSVDDIVDLLFSARLSELPGFAVAHSGVDELRIFVRGSVRVEIDGQFGPEVLDASERRTWLEQRAELTGRVAMGIAGRVVPDQILFRLGSGVVPAAVLVLPSVTEVGPDDAPAAVVPGASEPIVPSAAPIEPSEVVPTPELSVQSDLVDLESEPGVHAETMTLHTIDEPPVVIDELDPEPAAGDRIEAEFPGPDPEPIEMTSVETDSIDPYDHLFGATRNASVEAAAVRNLEVAEGPAIVGAPVFIDGGAPPDDGRATIAPHGDDDMDWDHDGNTQSLQGLGRGPVEGTRAVSPAGYVAAVVCDVGHANPPYSTLCRVCGNIVADTDPEMVPRPVIGVLVMPDGERVPVDRAVLVGRKPEAQGIYEGQPPRFVALPEEQEVSRTHLEFRVEGWNVTVMDHNSTFGTLLRLPGRDPETIRSGVPVTILPGAELVMADCVTIKFEVA